MGLARGGGASDDGAAMRLCTLNVHMWTDASGRANVDQLIEFLSGLRCDAVALQEVLRDGPQLERLAGALGMHHALAASSWLGNALLSPHPLDAVETVDITHGAEEGRCAVLATVRAPEGSLDVGATHLDPRYEVTRVGELGRLLAALARRDEAHAVMGDFNAIRPADYGPAGLAAIAEVRARHEREAPRGEAVARMDAAGYVDLFRRARAEDDAGYAEALARSLPHEARSTCWAGTRIDYAWGAPRLARRFRVRAAEVTATEATDHAAVVVDFAAV